MAKDSRYEDMPAHDSPREGYETYAIGRNEDGCSMANTVSDKIAESSQALVDILMKAAEDAAAERGAESRVMETALKINSTPLGIVHVEMWMFLADDESTANVKELKSQQPSEEEKRKMLLEGIRLAQDGDEKAQREFAKRVGPVVDAMKELEWYEEVLQTEFSGPNALALDTLRRENPEEFARFVKEAEEGKDEKMLGALRALQMFDKADNDGEDWKGN